MKSQLFSVALLTTALAACGSVPTNDPHVHNGPVATGNVDGHGQADMHAEEPSGDEDLDAMWVFVQDEIYATCAMPNISEPTFRYNSSRVKGSDMPELSLLATCMTEGPLANARVRLVGRADPRGSANYNKDLGGQRALAVRQFLTLQGVAADRIETQSAGELGAARDPKTWGEARRVDIVLL